jgi:hypothetical protein
MLMFSRLGQLGSQDGGDQTTCEAGFGGDWGILRAQWVLLYRDTWGLPHVELPNSTGDVGKCDTLSPRELMRFMSAFLYMVFLCHGLFTVTQGSSLNIILPNHYLSTFVCPVFPFHLATACCAAPSHSVCRPRVPRVLPLPLHFW